MMLIAEDVQPLWTMTDMRRRTRYSKQRLQSSRSTLQKKCCVLKAENGRKIRFDWFGLQVQWAFNRWETSHHQGVFMSALDTSADKLAWQSDNQAWWGTEYLQNSWADYQALQRRGNWFWQPAHSNKAGEWRPESMITSGGGLDWAPEVWTKKHGGMKPTRKKCRKGRFRCSIMLRWTSGSSSRVVCWRSSRTLTISAGLKSRRYLLQLI